MTNAIKAWIKGLDLHGKIVEFGAYDVNGSVREFFKGESDKYIGMDVRAGPGVDIVGDAHNAYMLLPSEWSNVNAVLCLEMLEHDKKPLATLCSANVMLMRGGLLVVTVPTFGYARHEDPVDYWRFSEAGLRALFDMAGFEVLACADVEDNHLYAIARKP